MEYIQEQSKTVDGGAFSSFLIIGSEILFREILKETNFLPLKIEKSSSIPVSVIWLSYNRKFRHTPSLRLRSFTLHRRTYCVNKVFVILSSTLRLVLFRSLTCR